MCCCEESKFASPNHIFFVIKHFLFGKTKALYSRYKTLITMTLSHEDMQGLQILLVLFCLYSLRNVSPFFDTVWQVTKIFLLITLIVCSAGLAIKWLKKFF